jgi:uncharacterized membrane protein YfhO
MPEAAFLGGLDPAAPEPHVTIESYAPDRVEVSARFAANGWLVLADPWYPGWIARVDDREQPILRADYNFRAVPLAAGSHRVVFEYRSGSIRLGGILTLLGVVAVAAGLVGVRRLKPALPVKA